MCDFMKAHALCYIGLLCSRMEDSCTSCSHPPAGVVFIACKDTRAILVRLRIDILDNVEFFVHVCFLTVLLWIHWLTVILCHWVGYELSARRSLDRIFECVVEIR